MKHSKGSSGRRGYHHGNLREALVAAALDLISEKGPAGFTFAEAARAAGVSPAAPYRHFRDREALLVDIAQQGFERLAAQLSEAWNEGRPDKFTAFESIGRAYLSFARNDPASYAAMFEAQLPPDANPDFARAADQAFGVVRQATEQLCADVPQGRRPPALMVSLHVWAMSHGIASLFGRGDAGRRRVPMVPEELLEAGMLIYLEGLGIRPGAGAGSGGGSGG
tara:strand:+ start:2164 stop:2832 length:669 start_codon:yes stop_codon:yes gene_type:complete